MDEFFKNWFNGFNEGLVRMTEDECSRLFFSCAKQCAKDALKYLYRDLFHECNGNLDLFFNRLHEVNGVDGEVIETGKVYDIIFLECSCDLHTKANVNSCRLCECSRQSIICEMRELVPTKEYKVEKVESVLSGDQRCRFRISEKA